MSTRVRSDSLKEKGGGAEWEEECALPSYRVLSGAGWEERQS